MSAPYQFGSAEGRVSRTEAARRDRICREEGGLGYVVMRESTTPPGYFARPRMDSWCSWYEAPGSLPTGMRLDLERRVRARVEGER